MRAERSGFRRRSTRAPAGLAAAVLAICLPAVHPCHAAGQSSAGSREYTIKAAYLYNFGRYVRYPEGTFASGKSPFVIGTLGASPLGGSLGRIATSKTLEGRKIVAEHFNTLDAYTPCQILFVSRSVDPQQQLEAIRRLSGSPVLLVGETPEFAARGGAINFFIEANKIRFEINQKAAERDRLKISSKLLVLARPVKGEGD